MATALRHPSDTSTAGLIRGYSTDGQSFIRNLTQLRDDLSSAILSTNPRENSAVMACLGWIMDVWPEAPIGIYRLDDNGDPMPEPSPSKIKELADLQRILKWPNESYGDDPLWKATTVELKIEGNAYWYKLRNKNGGVVGFQYLPTELVEPHAPADGLTFIDYYQYSPGGQSVRIDPIDIVHFRDGIDPKNTRKGISRLRTALREIFTDDEAANFVAAILYNMGIGGHIVTPDPALFKDGQASITITKEVAEDLKAKINRETRGSKRGGTIVNTLPLVYQQLGFSPEQIVVRENRMTPEERISAVLGVSASVAGLGAGLERNTFSNAATEEEKSYRRGVMPLHRLICDALDQHVLPEVTADEQFHFGFDYRRVNALQEDEDAKAKRYALLFTSDLATRYDCRIAMSMEADDGDKVYRSEWLRSLPFPGASDAQEAPSIALPEPAKSLKRRKKKSLQEAAADFRRGLIAKDAQIAGEFLGYLEVAEIAIERRWNELAQRIQEVRDGGGTVSEHWLMMETRYSALLRSIEDESQKFGLLASIRTEQQQREFVASAARTAELMFEISTESAGIDAIFNKLPASQLEAFAGFASDGSPLKALFDELGPAMSAKARETLASSIALGLGPKEIAKELTPILSGNRQRALTIARTEPHRAAREATRQIYLQNGSIVEGWTWFSAADERTCAACFAMHGSTHTSGQILDGHPQCRCVMVPLVKGADIPIAAGESIFLQLSEEEQIAVLGPEMHQLYRDGAVAFSDLVVQESDPRWGTTRRPATIDEALSSAASRTTAIAS